MAYSVAKYDQEVVDLLGDSIDYILVQYIDDANVFMQESRYYSFKAWLAGPVHLIISQATPMRMRGRVVVVNDMKNTPSQKTQYFMVAKTGVFEALSWVRVLWTRDFIPAADFEY